MNDCGSSAASCFRCFAYVMPGPSSWITGGGSLCCCCMYSRSAASPALRSRPVCWKLESAVTQGQGDSWRVIRGLAGTVPSKGLCLNPMQHCSVGSHSRTLLDWSAETCSLDQVLRCVKLELHTEASGGKAIRDTDAGGRWKTELCACCICWVLFLLHCLLLLTLGVPGIRCLVHDVLKGIVHHFGLC